MSEKSEKIALVTGGNSGIGKGIALLFASRGFNVIILGRDRGKGRAVEAEIRGLGHNGRFHALDLSVEDEVAGLFSELSDDYSHLDVVVNNAGLGSRRAGVQPDDPPGRRWDKLRGANLDSTYFVTAHARGLLAAADCATVVNISSTATLHGNWGLYAAAKAGVEGLTRAFAVEYAPLGIRVNCVSPGWIETGWDAQGHASGNDSGQWEQPPSLFNRMGRPEEIAHAVFFLASDAASFITGQTLVVDGGLTITDYPSRALLEQIGDGLLSQPE